MKKPIDTFVILATTSKVLVKSLPHWWPITFVCLLSLFVGGKLNCVHAVDEGSFQRLETAHFLVYADTRASEIQETARALEEIFALVAATFPRMAVHVPFPVEVIYFSQREDFDSLTLYLVDRTQYRSDMDLPYGFLHLYPDKTRIIITRTLFTKYIPELFRDVTRMLLYYSIEKPPFWLEEGLPGFMGSMSRDKGSYNIGKLKQEAVANLRRQGMIPITRFLRMSGNSSRFKDNEDFTELFKAQAIFFINYLFYADQKRNQTMFFHYIDQLINGNDRNTAFLNAFTEGTIALQASFNQHLMKMSIPYTIIDRADITLQEMGQPRAASRAEIDAVFGDEYIRHVNILRAEQFFSRGLSNDSDSLSNRFGMTRVLYRQSQKEAYGRHLDGLIEQTKDNYLVQRSFAFFLSSINSKQAALKIFQDHAKTVSKDICALKHAAGLAFDLNDLEAAKLFFGTLLAYLPDHVRWSEQLMTIFTQNNDYERATTLALQNLTRDPLDNKRRLQFLELIGKIDDTGRKASLLLRAHKLLPSDFDLNRHLAELYEQTGNLHAALAYYKRCLEQSRENEKIKLKMNELQQKIGATAAEK